MGIRLSIERHSAQTQYPHDKCLYQLFQEQAQRTPDRIAVVFEQQKMTYQELDKRSNQLAHLLQQKGVQPETLVALFLDRSIHTIISILATLKAGGAYVPVDPHYPADRIAHILNDSQCPWIISHSSLLTQLPDQKSDVLLLDSLAQELQNFPDHPPENHTQSHNLAYIIYTSGSTGMPKGVMVENRNVVRLFFHDTCLFDFSEQDVWSVFHSFCFDFSVWEMYGALLFGGKAVIIPRQTAQDPEAFSRIILKENISVLNQTPSAFYALSPHLISAETHHASHLTSLRYIIFGGEALNPRKLTDVHHHFPQIKLINMYGITETTVHVTYKAITQQEIQSGISNIGKPIPTLQVYILDSDLNCVPIGVQGELCVGGEGVTRGYLNRPQLTAEKFIINPSNPFERLYRSGDLASLKANGDLVYFGRSDSQVQLRGFRIELGEIESVMMQSQDIQDCAVILNETDNGDKRLIAYFIPLHRTDNVNIGILKQRISQFLPEYMMPSFYIQVEQFPLTSNGKLDIAALPKAEEQWMEESLFTPPANEMEATMAEIWGSLLNIESNKLKREHHFFDIGGHSLLAAALLQKIRVHFQKPMNLQIIYEHPCLKDLCFAINNIDIKIDNKTNECHLTPSASGNLPLTTKQLAFWLGTNLFDIQISNVCEVFEIKGPYHHLRFQKAFNAVAQLHSALWCPFSHLSPEIQLRSPSHYTIDLLRKDDESIDYDAPMIQALIKDILHAPFDLTAVPLFRLKCIKLSDQRHLLVFSLPHIMSDLSSLKALLTSAFDAYDHFCRDPQIPFSHTPLTSAKTLIQREQDYLNSAEYEKDREFWHTQFQSSSLIRLNSRLFFSRRHLSKRLLSKNQNTALGRQLIATLPLPSDTLNQLQAIANQANVSVQVALLACLHSALHTLSQQSAISTVMVHDERDMHAQPPAMHINASMKLVQSRITDQTTYLQLICDLKAFLFQVHSHARYPDLLLHSFPVETALQSNPITKTIIRGIGWLYNRKYGQYPHHRETIRAYITYVFGMTALWFKNVGRKPAKRYRSPPVIYNVLPSFYESPDIGSGQNIHVTAVGDREYLMNPGVFAEKSRFQDARLLNVDLFKDKKGHAFLHFWGGEFTPDALSELKGLFTRHLEALLKDPHQMPNQTSTD